MRRFLRPLGLLSGSAARWAVTEGQALPLAGGPLAFALVEIIERDGSGKISRKIAAAPGLRDELTAHCAARPPFGGVALDPPIVMGVVNATPDSFSDGGAFLDPGPAIAHAKALIEAGARIVDVGGESTRPGAKPVGPAEEIARILPVLQGIRASARAAGASISLDTRHAETMRAGLANCADIINDISALQNDINAISVVAATHAPVVLMHMQGEPETMQRAPAYGDVALEVYEYLEARIAACEAAGIPRARIAADPGIGFGKTVEHNLALLDQFSLFHGLGVALVVGVSRKGFIARLSANEAADRRLGGSLAAALAALNQGAQIVRAHDVAETVQAVRIAAAIRSA